MADIELVKGLAADADYMAVIAVPRPDGRVHASLVKAGVLEDPGTGAPSVGVVVAGSARRLELLRQAGRASVTFTSGYRWVSVEGPVHLVGPDDAPTVPATGIADSIRDVFKAAGGTHEDWDAFDAVMAAERRCAVFIEAGRVLTNRSS